MLKGKVKWFNDKKGFGFIQNTEGNDIFVHYSGIEKNGFRSLEEGQDVIYEVKEDKRGLQATNVKIDNL